MGSCIETCYIFLYLVRTFMYHNKTFFFVFFKLSFSEKQLHNLTYRYKWNIRDVQNNSATFRGGMNFVLLFVQPCDPNLSKGSIMSHTVKYFVTIFYLMFSQFCFLYIFTLYYYEKVSKAKDMENYKRTKSILLDNTNGIYYLLNELFIRQTFFARLILKKLFRKIKQMNQ